jgi:thiol-disulfide isomerase/thioredoxin
MRKYLPVVILFTAVFGILSFYIAREVMASITKKADVENVVDKSKDQWFKNFSEKDLDNKPIVLSSIKAPFVLVNFWASWCSPCLKEFPELVSLRKTIPEEKLFIVGINCDDEDPLKKIAPLSKKFEFNFPNIIDPKNKNLSEVGASSLPVTLLFHKGELIYSSYKQTNFLDKKFLQMLEAM